MPTENGQVCEIPFSLNETESYFCTSDDENESTRFVCSTSNGTSECSLGKFVYES